MKMYPNNFLYYGLSQVTEETDRLEIILPAVKTKITLAEQLRVQTTKALANTDALSKMSLG
jgi:hypothetical protein